MNRWDKALWIVSWCLAGIVLLLAWMAIEVVW